MAAYQISRNHRNRWVVYKDSRPIAAFDWQSEAQDAVAEYQRQDQPLERHWQWMASNQETKKYVM